MKAYVYSPISLICEPQQHGENCLYLGDAKAARDFKTLQHHKIQTAVPPKKKEQIKYHGIKLHDQQDENILQHLSQIVQVINKSRQDGNVFIHCYLGVSRSASFVIAYLISKGKKYDEARAHVKSKRSCICPNKGFVSQLKIFEKDFIKKSNINQNLQTTNQKLQEKM